MKRLAVIVGVLTAALFARGDVWLASAPTHYFHGSLANAQRWPSLTSAAVYTNIGVDLPDGKPVWFNNTNKYFKGGPLVSLSDSWTVGARGIYRGGTAVGALLWGQIQDGAGAMSLGEVDMRIRNTRTAYAFVQEALVSTTRQVESETTNGIPLQVSNQFFSVFMRWNASTKSLAVFLNGQRGTEQTNATITGNTPTNSYIGVRAYQGNLTTPNIGVGFDLAVWPWLPDSAVQKLSEPDGEWTR